MVDPYHWKPWKQPADRFGPSMPAMDAAAIGLAKVMGFLEGIAPRIAWPRWWFWIVVPLIGSGAMLLALWLVP